jgi:hypothetical protein
MPAQPRTSLLHGSDPWVKLEMTLGLAVLLSLAISPQHAGTKPVMQNPQVRDPLPHIHLWISLRCHSQHQFSRIMCAVHMHSCSAGTLCGTHLWIPTTLPLPTAIQTQYVCGAHAFRQLVHQSIWHIIQPACISQAVAHTHLR